MKTPHPILPLAAVIVASALLTSAAPAQGPVAARIKKLDIIVQTSPNYSVNGPVEKRISRNKKWLEFEIEFEVAKAPVAGVESLFVDDLLIKYFVGFKDGATGKSFVATGQVTHVNIEPKEDTHSAMYISPAAATRIRNKSGDASKTDVEAFAVQIYHGGVLIAEDATSAKASGWWKTGTIPSKEGFLIDKSATPFAPLWYDYFAEVKSER